MKKLKLITKILAIIAICLVGFVGIYLPWKKPLDMENLVKGFSLSKDLSGYREIILNASQEDSEKLNEENYLKSKNIVEERLNSLGVQDYNLSLDKKTGNIYLQIPENENTDRIVSNIAVTGSIELKDSSDESKTFLTSENLEKARYFYQTGESGTAVYLELQFNKDGKDILKDLSENEYKTLSEEEKKSEENSDENKEDKENKENADKNEAEENKEEKKEQKQVTLYLSGNQITSMNFDEPITDGKLGLTVGSVSTDVKTVNNSLTSARTVATLLNDGPLPIEYDVEENQYVKTDIKEGTIKTVITVAAVAIAILLIYGVIKYKSRGILAAISYLGFVSLFILSLKVFNVTISIEGIVGAIIVLVLNYLISMKLLKIENDNKKYYKSYLDVIMKLIPVLAISIAFVYMPILALSSLGMTMFWGIALILAYNVAVTKHIVD